MSGDERVIPMVPTVPDAPPMAPPPHLVLPGPPDADGDEEWGEELDEDELALPPVGDPEAPTPGEVLATALAVMTAIGVMAARRLWRRRMDAAGRERSEARPGSQSRLGSPGASRGALGGRGGLLGGGSAGGSGRRGGGGALVASGMPGRSRTGRASGGHGASTPGHAAGHGSGGRGGRPHGVPRAGRGPKAGRPETHHAARQLAAKAARAAGRGALVAGRASGKGMLAGGRRAGRAIGAGGARAGRAGRRVYERGRGRAGGGAWRRWRSRWTWWRRPDREQSADATSAEAADDAGEATASAPHGDTHAPPPPPPPPPPGGGPGERMRPPPGASRIWVEATRVYPHRPPPSASPRRAPSYTARRPLPGPGPGTGTGYGPAVRGALMPSTPVRTQFDGDSDLTVYDVIDADRDAAEEIVAGVDEAVAAARGCERLIARLEELSAKIADLRVPGSLPERVAGLMDRTHLVRAHALAIAMALPAAAEAVLAAADAAETHKRPADVTRDQGHARPAERDYHNE